MDGEPRRVGMMAIECARARRTSSFPDARGLRRALTHESGDLGAAWFRDLRLG